jgi:predicted phage terminase large subunit-like protein
MRREDVTRARSCPLGYATLLKTPTGRFEVAPHLVLINEALVDCYFGAKRRLIVTCPPGHSKSTTISRAGLGWHIGTYPERLVGLASYDATYAKSWGKAVRDDLREIGDEVFGVRVSNHSDAADRWEIAGRMGGMRTAGIEGGMTGRRLWGLVIDDPISNAKQAFSKTHRDAVWEWKKSVVEGRLEPGGWVVIVLTRWHEDDIAGRCLREERGEWAVLNLPALAERNDPMGRAPGVALWPKRFDEVALAKKKKRLGGYWWASQYQGSPSPESGNKIRREWFKFYGAVPKHFDAVVTSTDCSFKDAEDSSYVVIQKWGRIGADAYLLGQRRDRMDFPTTLDEFVEFHKSKPLAGLKLVEDKANGPALIATLKKKVAGLLPVEVSGKGSKIARLSAVSPFFESGNVYIPDPAVFSWVDDYIEELVGFPNATNDDQVDATSQALEHLFISGIEISLSGGPTEERSERSGEVSASGGTRSKRDRARDRERGRPMNDSNAPASLERINLWGP